ncbi:MAG: hypothetical protein ACXWWU_10305 [Candidatus Limnocylindria bacterium]
MPRLARLSSVGLLAAASLLLGVGHALAAETAVECGAFRDYVAPDAGTATSGSITFGVSGVPETIAPTATLVPPTDTTLSGLQGGTPTCLDVTRDGGQITSLAFAASGLVSGQVALVTNLFGSGFDAYVIADRVFVPVDQVATTDWEHALIKAAAAAGAPLTITFTIDVASGIPTGFTGSLEISGLVTPGAGDDLRVGSATLPASVIDGPSRALLLDSASRGVIATVTIDAVGTIAPGNDGPVVQITLGVSEQLPDTAVYSPMGGPVAPAWSLILLGALGLALGSLRAVRVLIAR